MNKKPIITNLFEEASAKFDTRKVLNRAADYSFNEDFMQNLAEEGLTLEMIEAIEGKVPIFKYLTQITIHGQFPQTQVERIHGYKNCIRNENGSLGLKYNAIDVKKKMELGEILTFISGHFKIPIPHLVRNSSSMAFSITSHNFETIKKLYDRIDTSLFYGRKYAYKSYSFFGTIYTLEIELGVMKADMTWPIITNWTSITKEEYETANQEVEAAKKEEDKKAKEKALHQQQLEQQNYEASITQLTHLQLWDKNISKNLILVSGLKNAESSGFQFIHIQPGSFGRIKYVTKNHPQLATGFKADAVPRVKTKSKTEVLEMLNKKKWFVWQQEEKPQPKPEKKPLQPIQTIHSTELVLMEYSEKAVAVFGDCRPYKELLRYTLRGIHNFNLIHPVTKEKAFGYIFPKAKTLQIERALNIKITLLELPVRA